MSEIIDRLYKEAEDKIRQEKDKIVGRIKNELSTVKQKIFKS